MRFPSRPPMPPPFSGPPPNQRAMEIALGPGKTVVMNGFMMYMSGAGIHIFSIMITFMGILNPAKAILGVHGGETFDS